MAIDSATVATRIGWPRRWRACSGATIETPVNQLHSAAKAAASVSAMAMPAIGSARPSAAATATAASAPNAPTTVMSPNARLMRPMSP